MGLLNFFFLPVPEKYENPKTQAIFETRFDMKKIRNEVNIQPGEGIRKQSDSLLLVGTFDPRVGETRVSYCLFSQRFTIWKHYLRS